MLTAYPAVDPANLQPGDLMLWPDHATMYVGNGMVLNANQVEGLVTHTPVDVLGPPMGIVRPPYGGGGQLPADTGVPVDPAATQPLPTDTGIPPAGAAGLQYDDPAIGAAGLQYDDPAIGAAGLQYDPSIEAAGLGQEGLVDQTGLDQTGLIDQTGLDQTTGFGQPAGFVGTAPAGAGEMLQQPF